MRLFISVKSRAKQQKIERIDASHFRVAVKEVPKEGKANEAILRALAEFFHLPSSRFSIVSGHTSKNKVIEFF